MSEPAALPRPAPPPIGELARGWSPAAVVLDVDGTLVDAHLSLHPRTRDAVRAAATRVPVVIATGRMYCSVLPWAEQLRIEQPLVCYQGALVRETPAAGGAVLFEEGLDPDVAVRAVGIARERGWHRQAYQDDELLCEEDRPEAQLYARVAGVPIVLVEDLAARVSRGTTKLVFVSDDRGVVEECIATMRGTFGGTARVTRSMDEFVEMVSPRVNKAAAVELVCARLGIGLADVLAVGDAPNDVEMLARAGCGVAVRTARDEVLAAADATCAPPDQAGVADVLAHVGLAG